MKVLHFFVKLIKTFTKRIFFSVKSISRKFHEGYLGFSKTEDEVKSLLDKNFIKEGILNCLCFPIVGDSGGELSGLEAIGDNGFVNNFRGLVLAADFEFDVRALFVHVVSFGSGFNGLMAGFGVSLALEISSEGFLKTNPDAFISSLKKII